MFFLAWKNQTHRLHRLDIARRSRPLIMKKDRARRIASQHKSAKVRIKTYHPGIHDMNLLNGIYWIYFAPCPKHWKLAVDTVFCLRLGSFHKHQNRLWLAHCEPGFWATPQLMRIMKKTGMDLIFTDIAEGLPTISYFSFCIGHLVVIKWLDGDFPRKKHRPNLNSLLRAANKMKQAGWTYRQSCETQSVSSSSSCCCCCSLLVSLYSQVYCIKPSNIPILSVDDRPSKIIYATK